jgi:hypothetical protein
MDTSNIIFFIIHIRSKIGKSLTSKNEIASITSSVAKNLKIAPQI